MMIRLDVLRVIVLQCHVVQTLHVSLDGGVAVDHLLVTHAALEFVDCLTQLAKLCSVVFNQIVVLVTNMMLVDGEGGETLAAQHTIVNASLGPALGLWLL